MMLGWMWLSALAGFITGFGLSWAIRDWEERQRERSQPMNRDQEAA